MPLYLDALCHESPASGHDYPPTGRVVRFTVQGSEIHAMLYLPKGPGPHPVTLLLHGLPGAVRNEDWAQALRRAGMAVLIFSYRGSWGSGGTWSYCNCYEDTLTICRSLQDRDFAAQYRLDSQRVVLFGHSFGGLMAMLAACETGVRDVMLVAPADAAGQWREAAATPEGRTKRMKRLEAICQSLGSVCAEDLWSEAADNLCTLDFMAALPRLKNQRFLVIGAEYDTLLPIDRYFTAQVAALEEQLPGQVTAQVFPTGHNFSSHRMELAGALLEWLFRQGY